MIEVQPINLRSFRQKARHSKRGMRRFLSKLENDSPRGIDKKIAALETEMWQQTDCLSCANCCKTMTPTFTEKDIRRIAAHLDMSPEAFRDKWLRRERGGDRDWLNKTEPCQFLNQEDNKCSIYDVRPADCAGFPHLRKKFVDYAHVHKQNVELCPATYRLVEKMMQTVK
ncbi:MAG: YkgJ family cysteine cluster protein [Chitinophagaceae bacterium]